jgi:hypothetical protein
MNYMFGLNFILKTLFVSIVFCFLNNCVLGKEVISPNKFSGTIAQGYRAAQKAKDICGKLFCYCGCDMTDEHTSLLDCFTSMHGVDCAICQEEAIIASHMKEQGKTLGQIQQTIDEQFSAQYPWDEASPIYENYLKTFKVSAHHATKKKPGNTVYNTKTGMATQKKPGHCCGH